MCDWQLIIKIISNSENSYQVYINKQHRKSQDISYISYLPLVFTAYGINIISYSYSTKNYLFQDIHHPHCHITYEYFIT